MTDQTVYHAQSQCNSAGLERVHKVRILPNGHVIRVYLDNFEQWRAVVFKSKAHHKGYAGLCLDKLGYVRAFEVAPAMRAYNALRVLSSFLRSIDIQVLTDMNTIKIAYVDGKCPDCGETIPDDVESGEACDNCGHIFCEVVQGDDVAISERQIELFITGYLIAALWSSTDTLPPEEGEEEGEDVNLDDYEFADGEAEKLHSDCRDFIQGNEADLLEYAERKSHAPEYDAFECAGHDFWLTRNGHGAGFWDRGLGDLGDRLSKASKVYGGLDLYLGDNECVYVYGV